MKTNLHRAGPAAMVAAALTLGVYASPSLAHEDGLKPVRADGHAPIGVMGDHMHKAGEFMLSYRFMQMVMDGNRDGTNSLSPAEVQVNYGFGVVPTEMTMDMHMIGGMYAPTDWLTLMAMGNYTYKTMDHVFGGGLANSFTTKTRGWGDTKLTGMIRLYDDGANHLHLNAGVSLPTGSIEETGFIPPAGAVRRLPYAMQLGSGTYDLLPGITYTGKSESFAWGAQASSVLRLGENDANYTLGDELHGTAWVSYSPEPFISFSTRVIGASKGDIDGRDALIALPVQTAQPENYGGETIELGFGVNLAGQGGLRGHRLAAEVVAPVYRDLNGPQLETDLNFTLGYQFAW